MRKIQPTPSTPRKLLLAAATLLALSATQPASAEQCLKEAFGGDAVCTAEDVAISFIEVTDVIEPCTAFGDTFTFNGFLHVTTHATQRYDIGFYLGPNAYTSTTSNCTVTIIPPGSVSSPQDGDACGDVTSAMDFVVAVSGVTATCADTNGDNFFDVSTCSTWRQQANATDCPDEAHALPGTKSKCNCEPVDTTLQVPQCTTNSECDDADVCTANVCDPSAEGADGFGCSFPPAPNGTSCGSDSNSCTDDVCVAGACEHEANTDPCESDGNVCTNDVCSGGSCTHPGVSGRCESDGNICTDDLCIDGTCSHPANTEPCAGDGNDCTNDVCTGGSCSHPANSSSCDDGLFCTSNDTCVNGTCTGTPVVCDDGKECSLDSCDEVNDECSFTECEPVIPDGEICRTAGFWSTHAGFEAKKTTAINITQQLLDAEGPLHVCGQTITSTSNLAKPYVGGLGLTSALEGLCVRVTGDSTLQLYRQLIAAGLNCLVTGASPCDVIIPEFSACSDVCEGNPPQDAPTENECIALLDCFNNGGEMINGDCAIGACASQPSINCGGDFGACPLFNGLPQDCVVFEDNCHSQELCNEDIGFCPAQTPATSTAACREAQSNDCLLGDCP